MRLTLFVLLTLALAACRPDPPPIPVDPAADTMGVAGRYDSLFFDNYSSRVRIEFPDGIEGRVTKLSGFALLEHDADTLAALRLVIDASSVVQTGAVREDVDLLGPRLLDAARYPEIVYEAVRMRRDTTDGSNVSIVEGVLTLWGQARALPLPVSVRLTGRTLAFNASFQVDPAAWDTAGTHARAPVSVRVGLVARERGATPPGASLRASQRYQDSLARTSPLVADSTTQD